MNIGISESFESWVGRTDESSDQITPAPIRLMSALLDADSATIPPSTLPPLWHWLYFLPGERQSHIGTDGHPRRGGFLPPITLPRRMWAGGRLAFLRPLTIGSARETGVPDQEHPEQIGAQRTTGLCHGAA